MNKDLSRLQADADIHAVLEILKRWRSKSDNKELKEFEGMMLRICIYVWQLQNERWTFDNLLDDARTYKIRALKRAKKAEDKLKHYEKI